MVPLLEFKLLLAIQTIGWSVNKAFYHHQLLKDLGVGVLLLVKTAKVSVKDLILNDVVAPCYWVNFHYDTKKLKQVFVYIVVEVSQQKSVALTL